MRALFWIGGSPGGLNGPKRVVDVPVPVSDGSLVDADVRQYARQ